jgi:myo-inositol-1(or 4)-monophosphatase
MKKELVLLLEAIQEAGNVILKLQQEGLEITRKANNDILTQADLQADSILKERLLSGFPDYGWLSEETADDDKRLSCERVWIVDPIDGTKEYASGLPEYAVSVALVEKGVPILSAVFNPAKNELFHAVYKQGAWLNNQKIACDASSDIVLVSRSEFERGEWAHVQSRYQLRETGSIAYKLALVAAGKALAAITYNPRSEWDIAAGVLLVQEAGGITTNKLHETFIFNQHNIRVSGVLAKPLNVDVVI